MDELEKLINDAEVHEEPEVADKPQEDSDREVPDKVKISEHRREGDNEGK